MSQAQSNFEYQVGGSLASNAPSYVTRQADEVFYRALKGGELCYVLNSRQMGKSSLRVRVMQRLQSEGYVCAFVDLTGIGTDITLEQWYAGFVQSLVSSCELTEHVQWRTWWRDRRDLFSPVQRLSLFIEEILLVEIQQNIIIFVDEIDRVLSQKFSLDDFWVLIRFMQNQRDTESKYQRLTFALLGVATPSDLIQDKSQTPFNIGKAIELNGFSLTEIPPLIDGLRGKVDAPDVMIQEILDWTGGQPFLTQKLCKLMALQSNLAQDLSVEQVVKERIINNWEFQDEPEHLRTIRDRICYRDVSKAGRLLGMYETILKEGSLDYNGSPEQLELRLSGLVVERQGKLKVYNRIYQTVFNLSWVENKLAQLRPYAENLTAWLASSGQDQSLLLQGNSLQDALTWAMGKSLSDADYQYLAASQELAKQEAQNALLFVEQANKLLATAKQNALFEVRQMRISRVWIPIIALGITIPILLVRFSGLLQNLEWNALDQFFRWRSFEAPDKRIVVVKIDESDITKMGRWPISDQILAQAITQIKTQKPAAIGLDLYRDLPVEPGHADLVQVFQSTPNLFGIEKVVKPKIAPPPSLKTLGQIGFSDQVVDTDGKIRRALLSVSSDEQEYDSLALKLALNYLSLQNITPKTDERDPQKIYLGQAIFKRFERNDGGYVRSDSGGYQILLNFRGSQESFLTVSLQQVLNNQIPSNIFRSRLVLIGTTAESINDFFYTPYSSGLFHSPERMSGVFIHANIISQILSATLDKRPLLQVWPKGLEWLWIFAWSIFGASISWLLKSQNVLIFSLLIGSGGLFLGCYLAFLLGWWLPVVPSLFAFLGAGLILPFVTSRQINRLLFSRTLVYLLKTCSNYPTAGRIAIEYLKQSETKEHQALIESQLRTKGL
ncbi:molecular chaperone TorD [Aphanothece hegewaldii CCALA 016]|uniref:Molecular chaperone TorD n=1 Tax=Aphanothece hegewaldii CCALA 016 TaxID=2107694 RepID=A0A2T1M2N0_9CHRO|nr:CHASE2 domain-containing protein [Aphanothece hegewaldii]PSF39003.1 molecular chaperone TorD [Aphanothece hegewaldii CCALA 016]